MSLDTYDVKLEPTDAFKDEVEHASRLLGIQGWEIRVYRMPHELPGRLAECDIDVTGHKAAIFLGKKSRNKLPVILHELAHVAFAARRLDENLPQETEEKFADWIAVLIGRIDDANV